MLKLSLALILSLVCINCFSQQMEYEPGAESVTVPLGGNAFAAGTELKAGDVGKNGIENWTDPKKSFSAFVYFTKPGTVKLWVVASNGNGSSRH